MLQSAKKTDNDLILIELVNKELSDVLRNILLLISSQKQNAPNLVEYEEKKKHLLQVIEDGQNKQNILTYVNEFFHYFKMLKLSNISVY